MVDDSNKGKNALSENALLKSRLYSLFVMVGVFFPQATKKILHIINIKLFILQAWDSHLAGMVITPTKKKITPFLSTQLLVLLL